MIFLKNVNYKLVYFAAVFALSTLLFGGGTAHAATLHLSPASGDLTVGNILNVSVVVNTQGKAINNADAVINFPASLLEVVAISKSGSIFTLWVEEPAFSNSSGRITFNGGVPTPGFNGSAGRLVTIAFRVKAQGTASVFFSAGSVRANDGLGTDILASMGTASYVFSPAALPPPPAPVVPAPEPQVVVPDVEEVEEPEVTEVVEPSSVVEAPRVVIEETLYDKIVDLLSDISPVNAVLLALIAVLVALIALLLYGRKRFIHLRSKVRRDAHDVEKVLHKSFATINEDIAACVELFEKTNVRRRLTDEEEAVVDLLKHHLRNTEKLVAKEVEKIRSLAEE